MAAVGRGDVPHISLVIPSIALYLLLLLPPLCYLPSLPPSVITFGLGPRPPSPPLVRHASKQLFPFIAEPRQSDSSFRFRRTRHTQFPPPRLSRQNGSATACAFLSLPRCLILSFGCARHVRMSARLPSGDARADHSGTCHSVRHVCAPMKRSLYYCNK